MRVNKGASISVIRIYIGCLGAATETIDHRARNVIAALLKRLAHRNPNVQLYTLSLAESLTKNCGIQLHREIASRAFTQGLERIIQDRVCTLSVDCGWLCTRGTRIFKPKGLLNTAGELCTAGPVTPTVSGFGLTMHRLRMNAGR